MKRVLEIGNIVAGPTAGLILSDLGYEVIKIEKPLTGDISRNISANSSGIFPYFNRNKKSVTIDIKNNEGKKLLRELIKTSDIIIENFGPSVMDNLGFSYDDVKKINKNIIYLSIKGYMDGPYEDRKSLDFPVEIESGIAYMSGLTDKPMRIGSSAIDMVAAMLGVIKILDIETGNNGGFIKIGLFETAMFLAGQHIATYQIEGEELKPLNEENFAWGVYDFFKTYDNKNIFIAIATDNQWLTFCNAFEFDYGKKDKFATNEKRHINRNILIPEIQRAIININSDDLISKLRRYNISYGMLNKPWDLLKNDHAMKYMVPLKYKNKMLYVPAMPFYNGAINSIPELGENSYDILSSLGYSMDEIDLMKKKNII